MVAISFSMMKGLNRRWPVSGIVMLRGKCLHALECATVREGAKGRREKGQKKSG